MKCEFHRGIVLMLCCGTSQEVRGARLLRELLEIVLYEHQLVRVTLDNWWGGLTIGSAVVEEHLGQRRGRGGYNYCILISFAGAGAV